MKDASRWLLQAQRLDLDAIIWIQVSTHQSKRLSDIVTKDNYQGYSGW